MAKRIYVTRFDLRRLRELINVARAFSREDECYLNALEGELDRARIVEPQDIPSDVVTMNSKVRLRDAQSGSEAVYTLAFPADSDPQRYKVSVLAPMGTAMLGYSVGDEFEWQAPRGVRRMRIEEIVYQPEAAGQFAV